MEVIMRHFKMVKSFSTLVLTSVLAACGSQVEVETREENSAGALQGKNAENLADACVTSDLQFASCVDPGELKLQAYNLCLQSDKVLTDLQITSSCANGLAEAIQYQCCAAPPPPPNEPWTGLPPLPAEPAPGCVWEFFGDGQTCQDYGQFKEPAYEACLQAGLTLTNLYVQDDASCSDWFGTNFIGECCAAPPPPPPAPPPVVCLSGTIGDGQTCQDLGEIKTAAYLTCDQAGLMLFDLQIVNQGSCSPSQGVLVNYQCTTYDANGCP
jgi:hypothetical protein